MSTINTAYILLIPWLTRLQCLHSTRMVMIITLTLETIMTFGWPWKVISMTFASIKTFLETTLTSLNNQQSLFEKVHLDDLDVYLATFETLV